MTIFRARHVELDTAIRRAPLQAWDTAAIAAEYEDFSRRWSPLPSRILAGRCTGAEAVRARTEVMDTYRRLPILDPHLPLQLLPQGWPRGPARELFAAVYDGLATTAQNHVRSVAARFTDTPLVGVQAHTVAELAAGVAGGT
jgi:phenylacetic acid degradation operon negative regulatory protein